MVRVAVIGCGLLGVNIAGELAYHGHYVKVHDTSAANLDKVHERLADDKSQLRSEGLLLDTSFVGPVYCLSKLEDAVKNVDFIFEAVTDDLSVKQDIFERLSHCCNDSSIIASNSLSHDITDICDRTANKERVIGVRFLYPVYCIPEVEIRMGKDTSLQTLNTVKDFLHRMGKTIFFRSGPTPLILSESQREARKCARKEQIKLNKHLGGRTKYFLPELAHLGNFAPDHDDVTYYSATNSDNECAICMDHIRDCVFHPCNHLSTCVTCGNLLSSRGEGCPICRKEIIEIIRIFHP